MFFESTFKAFYFKVQKLKSTPSQIPKHNTKKDALLYSYPGALSLVIFERV